jgi:hypothetical protein
MRRPLIRRPDISRPWRRRLAAMSLFTLGMTSIVPGFSFMLANSVGVTAPVSLLGSLAFGWAIGSGISAMAAAYWVLADGQQS